MSSVGKGCFERGEEMESVDAENLTVDILIEHEGEMYRVAMKEDDFEVVSFLVKRTIHSLVKTGKTQSELLKFLSYKK